VGQPFYPAIVTIPAKVNISSEKAQIQRVWDQVVADIDARYGRLSAAATAELTNCGAHNHRLTSLQLTTSVSFGGLELATSWPKLVPYHNARSRGVVTTGTVLRAIQPTTELLFRTIHDLGWHDLLFHTAGSFCLRGVKNGTAESARKISDHGFAIAFDMNVFENPQLRAGVAAVPGAMDPRTVKLFESFHFQCFRPPDLHHFDYQ
jgi:hypothetical protein